MDIKAPTFPESIADGSVAEWHHQVGDFVSKDALLVDIETDKVVIEVYAPEDGVLTSIVSAEGETVLSEEVIAQFTPGAGAAAESADNVADDVPSAGAEEDRFASPAAKKLAAENNLDWSGIAGTGKDGRITKEDVASALLKPAAPEPAPLAPEPAAPAASSAAQPVAVEYSDEGRVCLLYTSPSPRDS